MNVIISISPNALEEISQARELLDFLASVAPSVEAAPVAPAQTATPSAAAPPAPPPPTVAPPVTTPQDAAPPPPPPPPPPTDDDAAPAEERDQAGHPWDKRFHVASRNRTKDGNWRRKRSVTQEEVAAAFAGAANGPAAAPAAAPAPPVAPLAPVPPPPAAAPAGAPAAAPAGAPAAAPGTWEAVVEAFTVRANKYTQEQLQAALAAGGVNHLELFGKPEWHGHAVEILNASCPA